jgi:glycosyltransferase involved in cell wall biosynthesis
LEYSRLRVPTIASKVGVYKGIRNNFNGILVRNKKQDWIKAITTLIEDKDLRSKLADNAYTYVKDNRNIKTNAYKYLDILKGINDLRRNTKKVV